MAYAQNAIGNIQTVICTCVEGWSIRACGFLWYSVGLETMSLPQRLYRLTCAFGCVGSTCPCAFDVDFSPVQTWTCIGVVHINTHPNRTVCTIHQNSSYFYSSY